MIATVGVHDFIGACHLHTVIRGICIPTHVKAVGEIAAELTLCSPPPRAVHGGQPGAQMVQQREPLSAAALSL